MENERIILIRGNHSNWYEEAIFIVKKDVPKNKIPVDFVVEAEKIITNYMHRTYKNKSGYENKQPQKQVKKSKSSKSFDIFLNTVMLLSCVFITAMLLWKFV